MSEHIGADEAQAPGLAAEYQSWVTMMDEFRDVCDERDRLAAEVVRLRRELDARTDQPTAEELLQAVDIQYRAAPPKLPETWTRSEVAHYRNGWLDAMQRVKDSTDTAAAARLLGGGE